MQYKLLKTFTLCLGVCIGGNVLLAQQPKKNVGIQFSAVVNKQTLQLNDTWYKLANNDSFLINSFKFYVSRVAFLQNNKLVFTQPNKYYLINFADTNSCVFTVSIPEKLQYNGIEFCIGVDSVTNTKGLLTGSLDPLQGMYWTWHSGYINIKLEGSSNICKTRNNVFQLHIGGYKQPFATFKKLQFVVSNTNHISINCNLGEFITERLLNTTPLIMTPGKEAALLSTEFLKIFSIK